ncbi:hypothetical protein Tco_1000362, partial [Tanacetum coccineum]
LQTRGGTSEMETAFKEKGVFEEKAGGLQGKGQGASRRRPGVFEEKAEGLRGEGRGSSRRRSGVFSELNRGRKRRLYPLGEYFITLYTNGKLRTRVTVTLVSGAEASFIIICLYLYLNFFEGHTLKGVGLRVADSHTGDALLLQRFHAVVKAATEVDGCYGGCHIGFCEGCNEALWLMQRLPHRLKADAKAAIKVAGFYKGCHIVENVATLLKRLCRGYGLDILHKTNPNRGSYEGRDALTLRLRGGAFYEAFDRAFDEAFEEKVGGLL